MTLQPTGVEFVTKGYASFVSQMAGATESVASFGRMTANRLAAIDKFNAGVANMNATMVKLAKTNVAQEQERTKQAMERTTQAVQRTAQSYERTKQAVERTRNAWVVYRQEQERTKQASMHMVNALAHVVTALIGTKTAVGGAGISLGNLVKGAFFGNALWDMVSGGIRKVTSDMKAWIVTAVTAAGNLQDVTIRIENMIARQIRAAGVTDDMAQSITYAGSAAREALEWIAELAMATPFSSDKIADTFAFATAMGWTVQGAKDLTTAILDYSAAMGLTSETMDRIIFNFAQMKAAGKVTATEMRDLARGAYFPLTEILDIAAEKLGIAANGLIEFRQAAADGQIGVEQFFDAFLTYAERDFPGAARNLNATLKAVRDNFQDFFKTAIGWKMLSPAINLVSDRLSKLLKELTSNEALEEFRRIGLGLVFVFEKMFDAIDKVNDAIKQLFKALGISLPTVRDIIKAFVALGLIVEHIGNAISGFVNNTLIPFIDGVKTKMGGEFKDIAGEAFEWGANIIVNFAQGIIDTAVTVISAVMNFIGNMISGFLEAHSPPDILPDLPEWGAAAMAEYLRGFTLADFSMLDSIQGLMKNALDALVDLGSLGEIAGKEMFIGISESLIEAMDQLNKTGNIGQEIFEKLRTIGGGLGQELADLLGKQVDLAHATEQLAAAQEAYNAAVEATRLAQIKVNSSIRQYNKMLRDGASKADLNTQLKIVNAEEEQLDIAVDQQQAAKESVDMWEKAIKPLEEAVKLQEKLIQQLIELMRAQADLEDARKRAAARGGAGDGEDTSGIDLPEFDFDQDKVSGNLSGWLDRIKREMKDKLADMWEIISSPFKKGFGSIGTAWDEFVAKITPSEDARKKWADIGDKLSQLGVTIEKIATSDWFQDIVAGIVDVGMALAENLGTVAGLAVQFIVEQLLKMALWADENGPTIAQAVENIGTAIEKEGDFWAEKTPEILYHLDNILAAIGGIGTVLLDMVAGDWSKAWEDAKGTVGGFIEYLLNNQINYWARILGVEDMNISVAEILKLLNFVKDNFGLIVDAIINKMDLLMYQIGDIIVSGLEDLGLKWNTFWDTFIETLFGEGDESTASKLIRGMFQLGADMAAAIINGLLSMAGDIYDAIGGIGQPPATGGGTLPGISKPPTPIGSAPQPGMIARPMVAPAVAGSGVTISFGDTIIGSNMDAAAFKSSVIRVIRENL